MKPKEAIDWCEQFIDNLVSANVDTKKRTLGLKAMQTCKSALEKQIPKKPKYIEGDYDMPLCPNCGMSVDENEEIHCSTCGQAIDWGIVSE